MTYKYKKLKYDNRKNYIEIKPTFQGIKAAKDELIEKALEIING